MLMTLPLSRVLIAKREQQKRNEERTMMCFAKSAQIVFFHFLQKLDQQPFAIHHSGNHRQQPMANWRWLKVFSSAKSGPNGCWAGEWNVFVVCLLFTVLAVGRRWP